MSIPQVTAAVAHLLTLPADAGPDCGATTVTGGSDTVETRRLVAAARAGSRDAFGELVALHQRVVFRTALAALGSREDAEDATQEAFIVAWRKLSGFRAASSFRTWLLTIAWRKALDRRRVRVLWWKRTQAIAAETAQDPFEAIAGSEPDPERAALASDLARRVRQEIDRLSPKLRDTLLLAASGEYTYDQIAAMLSVPLGTVKWRVAEARKIVSARLEK